MRAAKKPLAVVLSLALAVTCLSLPQSATAVSADETNVEEQELTYTYEGHTFTYEAVDDAVTITGCADPDAETTVTELILPETIDSTAVSAVGDSAFYGYTALKEITLPETITEIGSSAFYGCSSLTAIDLPDGITEIETKTFMNCVSLKTVDFPDSLDTIDSYAFYTCQSLTQVCFPDSLGVIYAYAFYNCTDIEYVLLPAEEITIGENNFGQSSRVETIEYAEGCVRPYTGDTWETDGCFIGAATTLILPSSITSIDTGNSGYTEDLVNNYYMDFASLTDIVIPEDNAYFAVYDGCIYDKDLTTLYICAHGKTSIAFPDTVTTIAAGAFANCEAITEVVFPDSVTTIEGTEATSSRNSYGAFRNCTALTTLTVPASVTYIGEQAFVSCDALSELSFYLDGVFYHFSGESGLTELEIGCGSADSVNITSGVFDHFGTAYKQAASYMTEETEMQADLLTVILPASADSVASDFFDDMSALKSIEVTGEATGAGDYFSVNGILYRYNNALLTDCTLVRYPAAAGYADLASNLTVIGEKAFYYCKGIGTIEIPETVTTVEKQAFYYYMNGTVSFPEGLTTIGDEAFYGAMNSTVYLPASVSSIGTDAFYTLDNSLTLVCYADSYAAEYAAANQLTYSLIGSTEDGSETGASVGTKVTVGSATYEVTSSGTVTYVKSNKKNASKVTIPAAVKINGKSYKVTAVAASAFAKNTKLKTVVIGKNVKTIGKKAFYNCKNLKKITFKGKNVKTIGAKAFQGTYKKAVVKVPKAKKAAYKKLLKKAGLSAKTAVK